MLAMRSFCLLLGKALAALICAAGIWEIIARVGIASIVWLRYDHALGHVHIAGTTVVTNEGFARSTYDKEGYRSGLPAIRPRHLLLAVGDSLTEAAQVADSETFCQQANKQFSDAHQDVFLANAGLAGGCPARYVAIASWYRQHLQPERVIVQLDEGDFASDLPNKVGDFFIDPVAGGFNLKEAPHRFGIFERLDSSKLPEWAKSAVKAYAPTSLLQLSINAAAGGQQENAVISPAPSNEGNTLFPYVKWSVQALKQAYGDPILLYLPDIDYFDLGKPMPPEESELADLCRQEGVTLLDMRRTFVETFLRTGRCASGFSNTEPGEGHLNAFGHFQVAQALVHLLGSGAVE